MADETKVDPFFVMNPIPADKKPGWTVTIDGKDVPAGLVTIANPKFGTVTYGWKPEGYGGWVFEEIGRGGAITLPYARSHSGDLLVGLVLEDRKNMGGKVWCGIGGFLDPGETHAAAQAREASEEAGLDASRAFRLPGMGVNSNRGFFVANAAAGEGVKNHALALDIAALVQEGDAPVWKLHPNATLPAGYKKSRDVRFFPWHVAVDKCADGLALAAIAQLLRTVL